MRDRITTVVILLR